jgi:hypothetical protein
MLSCCSIDGRSVSQLTRPTDQLEAVNLVYKYRSSYKFGEAWLSEGYCECECGDFNYEPFCLKGLVTDTKYLKWK